MPSGNGDEWDVLGVITDLLQEVGGFLDDFVNSFLSILNRLIINLVDTYDHLLYTQSEGQQGMFSSLTILRDTSFEFTRRRGNHQNSYISL